MTPETAPYPALSYWIDSSARIVKVSGDWDDWLDRDGEGEARCRRDDVIGRSLFSFIESPGVQFVYQTLHTQVLQTGEPVELPSRCDSARLRRDLRLRISRDGDLLRYDSVVTRREERKTALPFPLVGSETFVAMCSFCKKFRFPVRSVEWKGHREAVRGIGFNGRFFGDAWAMPPLHRNLVPRAVGKKRGRQPPEERPARFLSIEA